MTNYLANPCGACKGVQFRGAFRAKPSRARRRWEPRKRPEHRLAQKRDVLLAEALEKMTRCGSTLIAG